MIDLSYISWFDLLGVTAAIVPVAMLAAFAIVDLRAVMLVRAVSMLKLRSRTGEKRITREEWSPAALHTH